MIAAALLAGLLLQAAPQAAPAVAAPAAAPPAVAARDAGADAPRGVPPTRLGVQVLARAPVVVVGRVIAVREVGPGADLVRVRVEERMRGDDCRRGDELSILAGSGQFLFGSEDLLFLRPYRTAGRHEIVERVSSTDPHWAGRLSVTRRTIWLLEIADAEERADAALDMLLSQLVSRDDWLRGQALQELEWMAREQRWVFTAERRARLQSAARAVPDRDLRAGVEKVTSLLTSQDGRPPGAPPEEQSRP